MIKFIILGHGYQVFSENTCSYQVANFTSCLSALFWEYFVLCKHSIKGQCPIWY